MLAPADKPSRVGCNHPESKMSASQVSQGPQAGREAVNAPRDYELEDDRGYGWVAFAGVLLMLSTLNFIEGLAAIGNAHFFTANANYIAGSLNTWGWVVLCIGVLEWGSVSVCSSRISSHAGSAWSSLPATRSCS